MKKKFAAVAMIITFAILVSGCAKETPAETAGKEVAKSLSDMAAVQQKLGESYNPNDPAAIAKVMDTYGKYGAQVELQELEKAEAVDAPVGFPTSLVYSKGKMTESSDEGDEGYVNKSITIKTTEDMKIVKEFYKNLLSQAPWKITSQSSESTSAAYKAKNNAGYEVNVDMSSDPYSKIINIRIWYTGNVTQ